MTKDYDGPERRDPNKQALREVRDRFDGISFRIRRTKPGAMLDAREHIAVAMTTDDDYSRTWHINAAHDRLDIAEDDA